MIPALFEVTEVSRDNEVTFSLEARSKDGVPFHFRPGQFNMLYAFGKGEIPISISGKPYTDHTVIHTVQNVGAVSRALTELRPGDSFGLRGPFGRGWPVEKALGSDLLLMAGGLGLAPLRPVIYEVLHSRSSFGRVILLYGARSLERLVFGEELKQWQVGHDLEVFVTLDIAYPEWNGHVGVVTSLCRTAAQLIDVSNATAFICGPPIMMRFSMRELLGLGVQPARCFVSLERNMQCGVGHCGHCQYGPLFLCKDGPVIDCESLLPWLKVKEL